MKKILLVITMILTFSFSSFADTVTSDDVTVLIDGIELDMHDEEQGVNLSPFILNDRTMIPLKSTIDAFGIDESQIEWNHEYRTISIISNRGDTIRMQIGNENIYLNENIFRSNVVPVIHNNRTYIPLSIIASLFNYDVEWVANDRSVIINPSTVVMKRFDLEFIYPVLEGFALIDYVNESGMYSFVKMDIDRNNELSSVEIELIEDDIYEVFDKYLKTELLSSDDFKILSNKKISFVRYENEKAIAFVKNNRTTIKMECVNFKIDQLKDLVESIKEVRN